MVDGGVFTNLDLSDAILRCKELVDKEEDIIIDMILIFSQPEQMEKWTYAESMNKNSFDFSQRKEYLKDFYYNYYDDVVRVMKGFPHINFRYIVTPTIVINSDYMPIKSTPE